MSTAIRPIPKKAPNPRCGLAAHWIVLLVAIAVIGAWRVRFLIYSTETNIERRIVHVLDALEDQEPRRIRRALTNDFLDETAQYGKSEVADAARYTALPGARYRGTLREPDGIEFLEGPRKIGGRMYATVRVKCDIDVRYGKDQPYGPFWDLEFTADMVRRSGTWKFHRTRDVNHDSRPLR